MNAITLEHFRVPTKRSGLPEYLVLSTVKETVDRAVDVWNKNTEKYELSGEIIEHTKKSIYQVRSEDGIADRIFFHTVTSHPVRISIHCH
jgi:hypothetical protein